jgi:hypothetical protein
VLKALNSFKLAQAYGQGLYGEGPYGGEVITIGPVELPVTGQSLLLLFGIIAISCAIGLAVKSRRASRA